jgi:hypothetical protein
MFHFHFHRSIYSSAERVSRRFFSAVAYLLALSLSGCAGLSGLPSAGESVSGGLGAGLSALTDMFSGDVRELKNLVNEGRLTEAQSLFDEHQEYFVQRWGGADGASAPPEVRLLAKHALDKDFREPINVALARLALIKDLSDRRRWAEVSEAWNEAERLLEALSNGALFKVTQNGGDEREALQRAIEPVRDLAEANKKAALLGYWEELQATSTVDSIPYIGPLTLKASDFSLSSEFQALALQRLLALKGREAYVNALKAKRPFLSMDSETQLDAHFVDMVQKDLRADGRISLAEFTTLMAMKTPFGHAEEGLLGLVRVGYADLSQSRQRSGPALEFPLRFRRDLALDLRAGEAVLIDEKALKEFDFVLVTDVAFAIALRESQQQQALESRYRSGTRQVTNPQYAQAKSEAGRAQAEYQRYLRNKKPLDCRGLSKAQCALVAYSSAGLEVYSEKAANDAQNALANTPRQLEEPVFTTYNYRRMVLRVKRVAQVPAVLIDVKAGNVHLHTHAFGQSQDFTLLSDLRADDLNRDAILSQGGASSEADVLAWAESAEEFSLAELFSADALKSFRVAPWRGAKTLVAMLNEASATAVSRGQRDDPPSVGGGSSAPP